MNEVVAIPAGSTDAPGAADQAASAHRRVKVIDGWRAIAASLVVLAHATGYRFGDNPNLLLGRVRMVLSPLAEVGVQLFFVISGYIITTLLLRERERRGSVSIAAFYVRRVTRIMPPLVVYYLALIALVSIGTINLKPASLLSSATFTCNTGIVDCQWWVAHTWSLAVEEQFYIVWPLLFGLVAPYLHVRLLAGVVVACILGALIQQPTFHGNFTSFGCIAAGALYASSPALRHACLKAAHSLPWLVLAGLLLFSYRSPAPAVTTAFMPVIVVYVIFAGNAIGWVRWILESRPLQWIGLGSYSLYLWQQLFLARPYLYDRHPLPVLLLPVVVIASVWLVERPFMRIGRRWSDAIYRRAEA